MSVSLNFATIILEICMVSTIRNLLEGQLIIATIEYFREYFFYFRAFFYYPNKKNGFYSQEEVFDQIFH